jgi:hypothetical protein
VSRTTVEEEAALIADDALSLLEIIFHVHGGIVCHGMAFAKDRLLEVL